MRYSRPTVYAYVPNFISIGLFCRPLAAKKPNFCQFLRFFWTSAFSVVANWQQSQKVEHVCTTTNLPLSNGNKIVSVQSSNSANFVKIAQVIRPCGRLYSTFRSNLSKNFNIGGPTPLWLLRWGVKFGTEPLLRAKFHPHRCNVSPLRGEKAQNRPLSKLNTGRFALRAMLPVTTVLDDIFSSFYAGGRKCAYQLSRLKAKGMWNWQRDIS